MNAFVSYDKKEKWLEIVTPVVEVAIDLKPRHWKLQNTTQYGENKPDLSYKTAQLGPVKVTW